jgi:hypothetical protein
MAALGQQRTPAELERVTAAHVDVPVPKFVLLNRLLAGLDLSGYRFVVFADDDIDVPPGFLDDYLRLVNRYDFSLSQPARTHDSFIDHRFVERLDGIDARVDQLRRDRSGRRHETRRGRRFLLPFDEQSPMGWGYDFTWPRTMHDAGLRLGIIDATPVRHSLPQARHRIQLGHRQRSAAEVPGQPSAFVEAGRVPHSWSRTHSGPAVT